MPKIPPGIEVRNNKNGTTYRAQVMIDGKKVRKTFKNLNTAISWKERMQIEREKNKQLGIKTKNYITYDELFEFFIDSKIEKRKTTIKQYVSTNNNHIRPLIGKKIIKNLNMRDYDLIKKRLIIKESSKHLVKKVTDLLRTVLEFAEKRDYLTVNFMRKVPSIKIDQVNYKYWNPKEVKYFLNKIIKNHYYPLYLFAFNTGIRRGEICGLMWDDVDLDKNTATLKRQRLPNGTVIDELKGHISRSIPLSKDAIKALKLAKKQSNNGFIFRNKKGKPCNPDNITSDFGRFQKELLIENRIHFHATRHSFATYMASNDVPIQIISTLLGHKDIKVTQRYLHLQLKDLRETINNFKY